MPNLFTDHPRAVGETYPEHLAQAGSIGLAMIAGGVACVLHGLFPFLFTTTGSSVIHRLHDRCGGRRERMGPSCSVSRP